MTGFLPNLNRNLNIDKVLSEIFMIVILVFQDVSKFFKQNHFKWLENEGTYIDSYFTDLLSTNDDFHVALHFRKFSLILYYSVNIR